MTSFEHRARALRNCRAFLSDVAASIATSDPGKRSDGVGEVAYVTDPVVVLWRDWLAAHRLYRPEVEIQLHDGRIAYAMTDEEIAVGLASPSMAKARRRARADLFAMTERWAEVDDDMGFSRAVHAGQEGGKHRLALAKALLAIPTRSVAGVAAMLKCFIEMNTPLAHYRKHLHPELRRLIEPTFPDLRVLMTDLVVIGGIANGPFQE